MSVYRGFLIVTLCALATAAAFAQVTTANLYGIVTDSSGAVVPNAAITLTHEGTGAVITRVAGPTGEFGFDLLRIGSYTLRIEAPGFKRFESKNLALNAGQSVRETFKLEVGAITDTVSVEGVAPLVSTASSEQSQTFLSQQVTELPLSRRNVSGVLRLSPGIDIGTGRSPRINGLGASGTGISVDGTDANSNPEQRSIAQYGNRNYVDVMSIDAVQEVQLVRGILPAEFGGVVGGQVNLISKSGTNSWHGSFFENYQSHLLNALSPFTASRDATGKSIPKPRIVFNQFGASAGGKIIRDKLFVFGAYEGYRESSSRRVNANTPTQAYRDEILRAYTVPEMKIILDTLPLPNSPINTDIGRYDGIRNVVSRDNHVLLKGDYRVTKSGNLAVTYARLRPYGLDPAVHPANDRTYDYTQDRYTGSYITGRSSWTFESRFGANLNTMSRLDQYFLLKDPKNSTERFQWGRSLPRLGVSGTSGFSGDSAEIWDMDGQLYSFDQKVAHQVGKHTLKFGARYAFNGGFRSNPENPNIAFQNKADFLANIPSSVTPSFGSPSFAAHMYELGGFVQDDWRVNNRLVLNLGLRYDFYSNMVARPTGSIPVGFYNLTPPKDWNKFDFGAVTDPNHPYNNDGWVNLGPRIGFAYRADGGGKTVVRGGFGVLYSPQMPGMVRQAVANPVVPFRVSWSLDEARQLGLKWPAYTDDMAAIVERQASTSSVRFPFSAMNPGLQNPYALHYQFNIQRELTSSLMFETGYVGVRGVKFILHRRPNLPDRLTGIRPNPNLIFGGYYVDNSQNSEYNAWQTSIRKRFSHNLSFDAHYTWSKGLGITGSDIGAYYGSDNDQVNIQDFNSVRSERGPNQGDAGQRFVGDWIYETPRLTNWHPVLRQALGGWEVGGIISARTGSRLIISETCASNVFCRPDYIGGNAILDNWQDGPQPRCIVGARCTVQYLNKAAFALVPTDANTRIAIRPGNLGNGAIRGLGSWTTDLSLSKNFKIKERTTLQIRTDMFNALNHVNLSDPSTGLNGATFGEISGSGGMRVIQFNGRLRW
ncbi:MAG TPA: TonB-dependent receptor [Candidatus Solibacter sp.]|nr:TonB-dependent receptor [Candidatus Solibacter sp.]